VAMCALLACAGNLARANAQEGATLLARWTPPTAIATSSSLPEDASAPMEAILDKEEFRSPAYQPRRPFENLAMAVKASTNGFGIDFATPLNDHFNLRAGASFTKFTVGLVRSGLDIDGTISLEGVIGAVDIFPFRRSTFHISPGFNFSNQTNAVAQLHVPADGKFSLGDGDYVSDPADPVYGEARLRFGNRLAPRLTVGWGNMIPHGRGHWSVPFEIGVQYISRPVVTLSVGGSVCQPDGCNSIAGDPNIAEEQRELQDDIEDVRVFPVASIGLSYRFGRGAGTH
jgi:hypothetical protein